MIGQSGVVERAFTSETSLGGSEVMGNTGFLLCRELAVVHLKLLESGFLKSKECLT